MTNQPGEVPIVLAGNIPLLSVREDALRRRHLTLNFESDGSTLQNTLDRPILFWNILHWRASDLPGLLENNVRLGSQVVVNAAGEPVEVGYPDGTVQLFTHAAEQLSLEPPMPGLYAVTIGVTIHVSGPCRRG